ncbi:MAG: hypothetical protein ABJ092_12950 [Gillisia sp.]
MKNIFTIIILLSITYTSTVLGQTKEIKLPNEFVGGWVMEPSHCEMAYFINIYYEDKNLQVSGYEWHSSIVELEKEKDFYIFSIQGFSEGEEFNATLKMKVDEEGNLILDDDSYEFCCGESTGDNKLIKCQ